MLQKKKVKQKKVVVQKMEWIEPLVDMECQQGKDKQVVMTAKLCVSGMKGKWYQRNETIMADIRYNSVKVICRPEIARNIDMYGVWSKPGPGKFSGTFSPGPLIT